MTEPSILPSGRIRDVRLPILLQLLRRERKTGVLTLRRNDLNKSIYLQEGDIVFATSLYPDDRLGEILLKAGKINFKQYEGSVELLKKTGKRQGTLLVEEGYIQPKDLFQGVVIQVKEIILSLFTWIDGEYQFAEGSLPSEEVITLQMSTADLILDGIKRIQDWTRLMGELPPLDSILKVSTDPRDLFQTVSLSPREREVINLIDGHRTLSDVLFISTLPSMDCTRILYFLLAVGIIHSSPSVQSQPTEGQEVHADPLAEEGTIKVEEADVLREAFFEKGGISTRDKIREAYVLMESQNHYEVLKVSPDAAREEIKKAYFTLAKEYHPDRHFESGMAEMKKELETLFTRITEVYDTLLVERKRKAYDAELSTGRRFGEKSIGPTASELFARGQAAFKEGDFRNASYFFEEAVGKMPESIEKAMYYFRYGQTLARIPGKLRDAVEIINKGIALDPGSAVPYVELGRIYTKTGLTEKAINAFREALKRDPRNQIAKEEIAKLQV